jgi:hypothetical protein
LNQLQQHVELPGALNDNFDVVGFISLKDKAGVEPPEHLPAVIKAAFEEGASCHAIAAHNAAVCMFRKCLDLATKPLLPPKEAEGGPNEKQRRDLGLRLKWLFENKLLNERLHDLAYCIREDGNEAAHAGSVDKDEAEEVLEFTERLLTDLITEPKKIELAKLKREERKAEQKGKT